MTSRTNGAYVRGAYAKTEQFRIDVLDAALRLVSEEGFDATTLQEVASRVGRTKAGVLHHFGSRENLMLEIVRHRDEVNRSRFPAEEGQEFEALFDLVAHNAQVPGLIALFSVVSALASADTAQSRRREYFETLYARNRTAWTRRIQRAQSEGVLRDDVDPQTVAGLILATLDGLQTQWLLDPSVDMVRHLRALVQILQARPA